MLKITVWCLLSLFLLQIYAIILTRHFIKVSVHRVLRRKPQVSCKNESVIICAIRCTRILPCKVFNVGSSKTFFSGQHDEMENSIFNKNNKEKENVGFRRKHDPVKNADAKGRQERVKKTVSGKHDSFKKNARRQRRKRKKNICHSLPSLKYARWQFPDKGKDSRRFVNVICDRKRKPFFVKKREVKCDAARKSWMTLDYDCLMSRITYADLSRMKHGIDLPCQLQYTSLLVSAVINPKFIFYLRNSKIPLYRVKVTLTRYTAVLEMCRDGRPKPIRTRIKQHTNVIFIQQSKHNDLEILFLGKEFYCTCGVPGFLDGVDQMSVHRDAVAFPVNYLEIILLSCFALGKNEVIHPALGIECLQCIDLTAPSLCMRRTKCSQDEICFTHKYTYSNIINYDMGCQTKRVCNMTNNRPKIIGRRDSKHTALHSARDGYSRTLCYECCDMEGCNSAMCTNNSAPSTSTSTSTPTSTTSTTSVTSTTSSTSTTSPSTTSSTSTTASTITSAKTTTTTTTTTTTPETVCSTGYVGFRSSCYAIVYKSVHWEGAQSRCHQLGSGVHLVSVNSLAEHQFLAKLLEDNHFPAKEIWIGGYVHPFFRRWTWDDGSTFNYTSWVSGYPINDRRRDRITMVNPTVSTVFSGWNWKNTPSSDYYAFICEVKSEFV